MTVPIKSHSPGGSTTRVPTLHWTSVLRSSAVDASHSHATASLDFDRDLASTMAKLSVKDRETALEEVNGIASCVEEESDAMEAALRKLEEHLKYIKAGTAYEEAEQIDHSHVSDRAFRVMFLRGNRYKPEKAAKQMIAFFDSKRMLFGKELLAKHITLHDLEEDDRATIRGGSYQVLPQRDRSGRQIVLEFWGLERFKSPRNEMRNKYYTLMSMLESEEGQKKGIVAILYRIGKFKEKKNWAGVVELAKLVQSIPFHLAGFHFCCDDYKQYLMMWPVLNIFSIERVARFRYHHGTHTECEYSLQGIGIPEGSIPISPWTGEVLMHNHIVWYRERQILEAERDWMHGKRPCNGTISAKPNGGKPATRNSCVSPDLGSHFDLDLAPRMHIIARPCDVVFGLSHKCHPGTVRLHEIVTENFAEYDSILDRRLKIDFTAGLTSPTVLVEVEHVFVACLTDADGIPSLQRWVNGLNSSEMVGLFGRPELVPSTNKFMWSMPQFIIGDTALKEVNGIANWLREADAMEAALRILKERLNDIKAGTSYEQAERIGPSRVLLRAFRLCFCEEIGAILKKRQSE
eukprot:scaffold3103_cov136-Cylindrotheca_fusiformis.AAC.29